MCPTFLGYDVERERPPSSSATPPPPVIGAVVVVVAFDIAIDEAVCHDGDGTGTGR